MNENGKKSFQMPEELYPDSQPPCIKCVVDGVEYTVKVHFWKDSKNNPREKLQRVILADILSRIDKN